MDNETESIAPTALKINEIEPNREQPRKDFDDTALAELADSIREHGVLQPLLVRPLPESPARGLRPPLARPVLPADRKCPCPR